ncbi:PTS transporter subunit EIIC [Thomasclavelia ramosa]
MNKRNYQILKYLKETEEYVTSETLSAMNNVSTKTILKDIKSLNCDMKATDNYIEVTPSRGIKLVINDIEEFINLCNSFNDANDFSIYSVTEREEWIQKYLIENNGWVKAEALCEKLFISQSVLSQNIKSVRKAFQKYDLILLQKPHYGMRVEGREFNKRLCLAQIYITHIDQREGLPTLESGLIGLLAYLAVCPNAISTAVEGLKDPIIISGLGSGVIGAQGLFVSMLISIMAIELLKGLSKIDAIKIKMPDSVPTGIARSFNILIPIFIIIALFAICGCLFESFTGNYLNVWIYNIIQIPLQALANTTIGIVVLSLVNQLFWFLGIHGGMVIEGIRGPLSAAGLADNIAAVSAGHVATNILTRGFWTSFVVVGGGGITLSLLIAILLFSRREDHKAIAKFSIVPGICGINEPVVFGLPLVLNPIFAIPFICNSAIAALIAIFATNIGFLTCGIVDCPPGLPIFITGFISYGLHGIIIQAIILVVTFFVWVPFVSVSNKQAAIEDATEKSEKDKNMNGE